MIRYLRLSLRYPGLFLNRHSYGDLLTYLTLHLGPTSRLQGGWACLKFLTSSDDHEDGGNKEQRSPGGEIRPPITARPKGAFCSPPSPRPNAIGTIPMIIASAVISTGRIRA